MKIKGKNFKLKNLSPNKIYFVSLKELIKDFDKFQKLAEEGNYIFIADEGKIKTVIVPIELVEDKNEDL